MVSAATNSGINTALLTPDWFPLRFHPEQRRFITSQKRFKAVVAGRGSGKTEIARRYLVLKSFEKKPWPDPKYFFVGPTDAQAERLGWDKILALIPPGFIQKKSYNKKVIELFNGAKIYICSGQKPERLEGVQWDGGVIDESSDEPPGMFDLNLGPAMTHRRAWCMRIGIPKRRGIGAKEFRDFWNRGVSGDPEIDSFHWLSRDILSEEELAGHKSRMSPQDFREQYEASWEITTGLAFPDFSKEAGGNVSEKCVYRPSLPIIVGSDFNVDPMAWALFHVVGTELHQFDEIWLRGTTTKKTLDYLYERYGNHRSAWVFIGDASSRARKTSASSTDYLQIYNDQRFEPKRISYPKANPRIQDRIATTNAAILNANDIRRYFLHPKCEKSISDFENRHYKEPKEDKINPGSELNDIGDLGHITDAIGYVICQLLPMSIEDRPQGKVLIET